MKKRLFIIFLYIAASLVLILTVCTCGTASTEDTTTPFNQLQNRVSALESSSSTHSSQIATIQGDIATFAAPDLTGYALLTDLPDLAGYVTAAQYNALVERIAALEAEEAEENGSTSGEITVKLDTAEIPYTFATYSTTPTSQVMPVKITNGTSDYYEVIFNVTLRCVSSDHKANVLQDSADDYDYDDFVLRISGEYFSASPAPSNLVYATDPSETIGDGKTAMLQDCQYIHFLWVSPYAIPVAPGQSTTVYLNLDYFVTDSSEVWQVTLSDVFTTEL